MPAEPHEELFTEQPPDQANWQQLAHGFAEPGALDHPGVAALYENHVVPQLHSRGLGHLAITSEDKAGARFLHKYGAVDQTEVGHVVGYLRQHGTVIPDKAAERTAAYLDFMANDKAVNDGILTGDKSSIDRQISTHVIKAANVPEGYFNLQRRIAREQGHGDVEITPDLKRQLVEAAQADQRGSLEKWVEYLGGEDGSYPNWFKRYTWDSVVKLGTYNKETNKFGRRDDSTVAPYPELNREALAYVYDTVHKFHVQGEQLDDTKLVSLLKEANFGRLYAHAVLEVTPDSPEARQAVQGSWTKFNQSSDPRVARRLSGSLQGHGTGWCTAGESTAASQLGAGDFYVYYSRDEDSKDTVPRIAVRMQNGSVAEVRGVNAHQELEPVMADIASDKLQDLPGGESYIQKAADMKRLTSIDALLAKDPQAPLSREDVKFLYELDHTISGFGYQRDPRIDEVRAKRGNLDHTELKLLAVEHLREHFTASYEGYDAIIQQLKAGPLQTAKRRGLFNRQTEVSEVPVLSRAEIEQRFTDKLATWQQAGVLDYVAERIISHGELHTPVIRPNVVVPVADLKQLAHSFAKGQAGWDSAYVYDPLYDAYTTDEELAQLSGYQPGEGAVSISLIPSKVSDELGYKTADQQLQTLARLRAASPGFNLRVPSLLEALTLW